MTLSSMTGFGRASLSRDGLELTVEVKSVNHRFLDVVFKVPQLYNSIEAELNRTVRSVLSRGRVEVYIARNNTAESAGEISFNRPLFQAYAAILREASTAAGEAAGAVLAHALANVLSKREVIETAARAEDGAAELEFAQEALRGALEQLAAMRAREGVELEKELLALLGELEHSVEEIGRKAAASPAEFKQRLEQRLERLAPQLAVEPERIAQEAALLADRIDITEEVARLKSHFLQFRNAVSAGQGGRKLEFLLQEIGRELNTTGSKAQDAAIVGIVIEAKAAAEKLREQVQNIE